MDPQHLVKTSAKYKVWRDRVLRSGCEILKDDVLYIVQRNPTSYYTALVDCEIRTPEGQLINRCLFLRGPAVVIIPILLCEGEVYTVMVRQRRIVDGEYSVEFPSGGLVGDPLLSASIEVKEELGFEVAKEEMVSLTTQPIKVCESLFDEVVHWFAFKKEVNRDFLNQLQDKHTGLASDQEYIQLTVMNFAEVAQSPSFQALAGLQLLRNKALI